MAGRGCPSLVVSQLASSPAGESERWVAGCLTKQLQRPRLQGVLVQLVRYSNRILKTAVLSTAMPETRAPSHNHNSVSRACCPCCWNPGRNPKAPTPCAVVLTESEAAALFTSPRTSGHINNMWGLRHKGPSETPGFLADGASSRAHVETEIER